MGARVTGRFARRRHGDDETGDVHAPDQEREYRPLWALVQYQPRPQGRLLLPNNRVPGMRRQRRRWRNADRTLGTEKLHRGMPPPARTPTTGDPAFLCLKG